MDLRAPAPSVIHGSGVWEDWSEWCLHPRFAELWTVESPENGSLSFTHSLDYRDSHASLQVL